MPDSLTLAIAAGRLFQAVTKETVENMTNAEVVAWLAFTDALQVRRFLDGDKPVAVEAAGYLDPIRYVD